MMRDVEVGSQDGPARQHQQRRVSRLQEAVYFSVSRPYLAAFVLAGAHLTLAQIAAVIGILLKLLGFPSVDPVLTALSQLPLTPLLIDSRFWIAPHRYDAAKALVTVANSLLVSVGLVLVARLLYGTAERRG